MSEIKVGDKVRYWRGVKRGESSGEGVVTRGPQEQSGTDMVWIEGCSGSIALTHVELVVEAGGAQLQKEHIELLHRVEAVIQFKEGRVFIDALKGDVSCVAPTLEEVVEGLVDCFDAEQG